MRRHLGLLAALAAALLVAPSQANAEPPDQRALAGMKQVQFLVGKWNCAHTVGDFSGTYTTSFTKALGDLWLKQRYDFPATKTDPAWYGEFYWGYDPRVPRWVRFGAMSTGMYFAMVTKDANAGTFVFDYRLPGANATATWTKKSETEFTIDGPSYPENGRTVTEHHDCKKGV